jgi:hypothetical protein
MAQRTAARAASLCETFAKPPGRLEACRELPPRQFDSYMSARSIPFFPCRGSVPILQQTAKFPPNNFPLPRLNPLLRDAAYSSCSFLAPFWRPLASGRRFHVTLALGRTVARGMKTLSDLVRKSVRPLRSDRGDVLQ